MKYYVLFNPLSANGNGKEKVKVLAEKLTDGELAYVDVTQHSDARAILTEIPADATVVLCGGDGTINRFVNDTRGLEISQKILYYPCGSGNDFAREVQKEGEDFIPLNEYIQNLPVATVKGKEWLFINGIGFGIDGYCCEVGDKIRAEKPNTKIDYTGIAIKGLLFHYKPTNATVIVDGVEHTFKKVWIAPTMKGWYYGGGINPAPAQDRKDPDGKVSLTVFHGSGRLKTLIIFPNLFKGTHVSKKKNISIFTGKEITVKFESPRALQVDGETVLDVTEYTVKA
jgi:diacylglycerol kinase family enzyme